MTDLSNGTYAKEVGGWAEWIRTTTEALGRFHGTEGYEAFRDVLEIKLTNLMVSVVDHELDEKARSEAHLRAQTLYDVISLLRDVTQLETRRLEMSRIASRRAADAARRDFSAENPDPAFALGRM